MFAWAWAWTALGRAHPEMDEFGRPVLFAQIHYGEAAAAPVRNHART